MNVKLSHDVSFNAVVVDGAKFFPNSYKVKISMITLTENSIHQNVAIQRILIFLREIFSGSVFCCIKNPVAPKLTKLAKDSRVILFPEEPYDQIVAMLLFHKLHAVVEGNFEIESIEISSNIAPDLKYTVEDFEKFEFDSTKVEFPWWERPDPSTSDNKKEMKNCPSWSDINLDWESEDDKKDVEIVFEIEDNLNKPDIVVLDGGDEDGEES